MHQFQLFIFPISDLEHDLSCLRQWLDEVDAELKPLQDFRGASWSIKELQEKLSQHKVCIVNYSFADDNS